MMDGDVDAVLQATAAAATTALATLAEDHKATDARVSLRDSLVCLLDVLGQATHAGLRQRALHDLQRLLPMSTPLLHMDAPPPQATGAAQTTILPALLVTLSALTQQHATSGEGGDDTTRTATIHDVVGLLHGVCQNSISSADAVQLFDFVRVSRGPARRAVLAMLQALLAAESEPRAVFTCLGTRGGLLAPSTHVLVSKKGYSMSMGIRLRPTPSQGAVVALYSLRGVHGHGVSASLEGSTLVLRTHGASNNAAHHQINVPFAGPRERMERTWVHLCVVHAKKMVFKDKLTVYVDGEAAYQGHLPYPDPLLMVGGQNAIGVGLQGSLWSPTLFGLPLADSDVQRLRWTTHWKSDLGSVVAENTGMTDKSKFVFSYDARSCDLGRRECLDVSGNDCHGELEQGMYAYVTQSLRGAMDCIGGSACFLLLLLDQIPELADFHPKHELSLEEISGLLGFVATGLQKSIACRSHFLRAHGVNVLAFILNSMSPQYLTPDILRHVTAILEAILDGADPERGRDCIHALLFQNANWFLSPFETQIKLLDDVLVRYLKRLEELRILEWRKLQGATPSSHALVAVHDVQSHTMLLPPRKVDVAFFCNILVQVYAPRAGVDDLALADSPSGRLSTKELELTRKFVIERLIHTLLFPEHSEVDDDLQQWRQIFAHIHHRCANMSVATFESDRDGIEVKEILNYFSRILNAEATQSSIRQVMTTKLCKLSKGTLRLFWQPMRVSVPEIRVEALHLFESYCSDKVLLKRRDVLMLLSVQQAQPITSDVADLLINLIIGRKHNPHQVAPGASNSGRSVNAGRLEFLPSTLLGLSCSAEFCVQALVLYEIKAIVASASVGDAAKEAIRSWPPWLSRLRAVAVRANGAVRSNSGVDDTPLEHLLSAQQLNEICGSLADEHSQVTTRLDAINSIAAAKDSRGCDFVLSIFQNAEQPGTVSRAIVSMVIDIFPTRSPALVTRIANQLVVDVMVYSLLHVRNGWIHFLEFYFCHFRCPSDLCALTVAIIDKLLRRIGLKASNTMSDTEFLWENISQVASVVSMFASLGTTIRSRLSLEDDTSLSRNQEQMVNRKCFELWLLILPRLHLINWEQMKAQLLLNTTFSHEIPMEEKEIFCHVVAGASHARHLLLQVTLAHLRYASQANEIHAGLVGLVKSVFESLRLVSSPQRRSSLVAVSSSSGVDAYSLYTADVTAFLGESRRQETSVPRELMQLWALDTMYKVLADEVNRNRSFKTAFTLLEVVVLLASAAIRLQGGVECSDDSDAIMKSLQIVASTDTSFFHENCQLQELLALWRLHFDVHAFFCNESVVETEIVHQNMPFTKRWIYLVEHNGNEFNPFLISKDAMIQADLLGQEMAACDAVWKQILTDCAAHSAAVAESQGEDEGRLTILKQDAEKYACSVHQLLAHSDSGRSSESTIDGKSNAGAVKTSPNDMSEGCLWKVHSKENAYRMRLILKQVRENYRLRNLSCEYGGSIQDEDGLTAALRPTGPRRLQSLRDAASGITLSGFERSWRSEAGSDYSDFLADAQMRAAIIRSCPSIGDRDSFNGEDSDDDDADDGAGACSGDEGVFEKEVEDVLGVSSAEGSVEGNSTTISLPNEHQHPQRGEHTHEDLNETAPSSSPTVTAQPEKPSGSQPASPFGSYSGFGASILSVVGGVTEMVTKAAKDAKDAVEYGVDSLYTAKDVFADEAQSLVQEVSTIMDSNANPNSPRQAVADPGDSRRLSVSIPSPPGSTPTLFPPSPPGGQSKSSSSEPTIQQPNGQSQPSKPVGRPPMSRRELQFDANLVRHMSVVAGKLVISDSHVHFVAERVIDEHETVLAERTKGVPMESTWRFLFKRRRWRIDDIVSINRRRYLLKPTAIEIFVHSTRKNYFFNLTLDDITRFHDALMSRRPTLLRRDPTMRRLRHPSSIFRNSNVSVRWMNHEISTFEYLMWLNTIAGRTYNDLTQYPVFPWVLADYESPVLDMSRASTFRDLTKPIGALEPSRLKFYQDRYNAFDDSDIPKFMYGSHYSNIGAVLFYLIRLEPFTSYALSIQGGKVDHADRLFHSVAETWRNCLHDFNDLKELTPEWFYLPEFLKNVNGLDLGIKQNGVVVDNVVLPPWASSAEEFVLKNLMALESEYVSANIHHWIDLVFGFKQRGQAAVAANNVFFYLTYEGMVDIDSISDPVTKSSMRAQIAHFGQTPTQVLREHHPPRQLLAGTSGISPGGVGPNIANPPSAQSSDHLTTAISGAAAPLVTLLTLPHDHPIVLIHLVPGTSSMVCVDRDGHLSVQRYGGKSVKVHNTPFLNDLSTSATKATGVFKASSHGHAPSSVIVESSSDAPPEYIEVHEKKCRRVVGDRKLMQAQLSNFVKPLVFLNAGAVFCTIGHHDFSARFFSSTDGALLYRLLQHNAVVNSVGASSNGALLALGGCDGTISIWKVAAIASTLLDSIKIFRGSKSTARPVHANDYAADQVLLGHSMSISCLALSEDLGVCVSGSIANECIAHTLEDGSILRRFDVAGRQPPGIISLAVSPVGHVVVQSMGTGAAVLYSFHINGTLLAHIDLGGRPMTSLDLCTRYAKVIVSNATEALSFSAHALDERQVLLSGATYGEISTQALSPDETHVVFGVGNGRVVAVPVPRVASCRS